MMARGPFWVNKKHWKPGTYCKQHDQWGNIVKESAASLNKIPSTSVIHKPTAGIHTRHVIYQLENDDTEQTIANEGHYNVWFYIRELANSKIRKQCNLQFWPEVRQLWPNETLGLLVPIQPGCINNILQHGSDMQTNHQPCKICKRPTT